MDLFRLSRLESRAATAENIHALKGAGGRASGGTKGSPAIKRFRAGATETLLDTNGPGMIRHIWCTTHRREPLAMRNQIIRIHWEQSDVPSVEAPLSDFFGVAHGATVPLYSRYITMQEGRGFNCFFPMPFSQHARVTITNETGEDIDWFFYQIDFTLGDRIGDEDGRFHAHFRRENPGTYGEDYTILRTSGARGVYVGTVLGVRPLAPGWWGEGEVKMYLDGDDSHPTICGTGIEDYIGSAWGLETHSALSQGAPLVAPRFTSLYRLHIDDPVYFQNDIRVTVQQMGAEMLDKVQPVYGDKLVYSSKNHPNRDPNDVFYLRADDYCSTAYWYQWPLISERERLPNKHERSADLFGSGTGDGTLAGL
jgi:hypothetical protein